MRTRFEVRPADESFYDSAPERYVDAIDIARPAEQVWADLTGDNPLAWCKVLQRITWTSPRPFGVGTTRTARALGGLTAPVRHDA
jgi:hypothetical protein